ncbi:hypothetical protein BGHDH14_bgh00864 [Blumeria hordei DH14]|uniref:prephenate dehydratase n=2 Tax=Blumeria hordei TaxID=2867405 RepID=N1JCT3_BLUG1|nr:hypothetical protein BGHDH14_bgh00864 [Blumeria hordei DH14]
MLIKNSEPQKERAVPLVAYLGPAFSFTHQAAIASFNQNHYNLVPASSISGKLPGSKFIQSLTKREVLDVFEVVYLEDVSLGVVPIENSTNGAVNATFDLMADREEKFPDVKICDEAYLRVSHCLLGRKLAHQPTDSPLASGMSTPTRSIPLPHLPRTTPNSSLKHIKRIFSHPQAWGQCEVFLAAFLKNIERINVDSTSRAAELARADVTGTSAAISSGLVAEIQGLDILAEGIEDRDDNTTRFVVLCKGVDMEAGSSIKSKTIISLMIDDEVPGALASTLQCFAINSVNLTNIISLPTMEIPFQYIFFLEFEGSIHKDPDDRVKVALDSLKDFVQSWKWLGSWNDRIAMLQSQQ